MDRNNSNKKNNINAYQQIPKPYSSMLHIPPTTCQNVYKLHTVDNMYDQRDPLSVVFC